MGYRSTSRGFLLFLAFAIIFAFATLVAGFSVKAAALVAGSLTPTISSDQADYPPGATVVLTGSNWQPGESVNIYVNDDEGRTWDRNIDVTADESGAIRDEFQLPDWFVATYKVTATGEQSGVVTTTFTDSVAATASVDKKVSFRNTTGNAYKFTINNTSTGAESLGSIEIRTPPFASNLATTGTPCETTQSGWTAIRQNNQTCRYTSASGTSDNIGVGTTSSDNFKVTVDIPDGDDANGAWGVTVKSNDDFGGGGSTTAGASSAGALTTNVYSFEVADAVIAPANSTVTYGGACPTQNKTAPAGSTRDIVICGTKYRTGTLTPRTTNSNSSLSGTMLASNGTFNTGPISTTGTQIVLAKYTGATISAAGSGKTIAAKIGSADNQTSPSNTLSGYVSQVPTSPTSISAVSGSGTYGGNAILTAKLTSGANNLSNKTIEFKLRNNAVCDNDTSTALQPCPTTDANGVATLNNVSLSGINAGGPAGTGYAGAVSASFTGDANYNATGPITGDLTVNKKAITITPDSGQSKVYGSSDPAALAFTNSPALESGDSFSGKLARASGESVGSYAINLGNLSAGTNYNFSLPATPVNFSITPKSVTGSFTAGDKVYDGDRSAEVVDSSLAPGDVIDGDTVNLDVSNAQFADKKAGNGKTVSATLALSGGEANNYILTSTTANATADITVKPITGSFSAANKVYDGNTDAAASNRSLTGAVENDAVSLTGGTAAFDDKNVGDDKPVTLSGATLDGDDATNYSLSSVDSARADITPLPIKVSAVAKSKTYGEADPPLTYETDAPLLGDDEFTGSLVRDEGEDVGSYPIRQGSLSAGPNYSLTYNGANLSIEQATATLSLDQADLDQTYNGQPRHVDFSISPESLSSDVSVTYNDSEDRPTNAGSYDVEATLSNANYKAEKATGTLVIQKSTPEISWSDPAPIEYGTLLSDTQLNATASGVNGGNLPGNFVYSPPSGTKLDAGTHQLTADFTPADSTNYNDKSKTAQINVEQAGQTIDFGTLDNKTFGDPDFQVSAEASSGLPVSFEASGNCSVSGNTVSITGAGSCTITASQEGNDNYNAAQNVEQSFQIVKATAQISLGNLQQVYNGSTREASASTAPEGLNVSFAYSQDGSQVENPTNAGSYHVVATINDDNYKGSAEGTLVISKAQATINLGDLTHTYDGTSKSATVASTTPGGLGSGVSFEYYNKNADGSRGTELDGPPINAGNYIAVATLADPNYEGRAEDTLTINKAHAEITLSDLVHTYDGTAKSVSVDVIPEPAKNSATRNDLSVRYYSDQQHTNPVADPTNAGTYYVVASLDDDNYIADDALDTLVINKASLTVTADDKTRPFGQPNPDDFTASFSGFVNGENESVLTGSPDFDTDATASSPVGTYDIVPSAGTLSADNYSFSFQNGTLRIIQAGQTIDFGTLDNKTFGDPDFQVSAEASSGLPVSFEASGNCSVSGNTVSITGAGSCTITASQAGNGNYEAATPVARQFNIGKATATLSLNQDDLSQVYDGSPKEVGVDTTPDVPDRQITVKYYSDEQHQNQVQDPTNAGTYYVVASLNEHANYQADPVKGILEITQAHADIILSGLSKTYNGSPQGATVDTDPPGLTGVRVTYDSSTTLPTNAGSYTVEATLTNGNYTANPIQDTLVIAKAAGSVSINNIPTDAIFGGNFTPSYTKAGDGTASTTSNTPGICSVTPSGAVSFDTVGTCKLQASITEGTNYLAATGAERSFTIGKASTTSNVTVTLNSTQYSDKVDLVATLSPDSLAGDAPATGVTFNIGTRTVGTANLTTDNNGKLKATLSGVALTEAPGSYTVTAQYTGVSPNFTVNNATAPLTVARENATAGFSGPLFYAVPSGSATVTLSTVITDAADDSRGDITKANVTFVNRDTGATLCTPTEVVPLTPGDTTVGAATCNVSLPFGTSGSTQYTVGIKVNGYYVDDNSAENTVVTVSQAINGMITGGGYLMNPSPSSSGGRYAADAGQKTNFGFNVKYNKSLTNLQGTINTIVRSGGRVYQIKGNAMSSLTTKPCASGSPTATCPATATFNGKANIQDITNPLAPVSVVGNALLQVTMTDKGEPGKADTIGIQLTNTNGSLLFSSKWVSPRTAEDLLAGGNLVVR